MRNLLVTGRPGVGKTTLIRRLVERPIPRKVVGFFTQEVREGGTRTGFSIETLDGKRGVLASVDMTSGPRVGKYRVNIRDLERIGVPCIEEGLACSDLLVIDEIGKMELFSERFRYAVMKAFDSRTRVLATIKLGGGDFVRRLTKRPDTEVLRLTETNRGESLDLLLQFALGRMD